MEYRLPAGGWAPARVRLLSTMVLVQTSTVALEGEGSPSGVEDSVVRGPVGL